MTSAPHVPWPLPADRTSFSPCTRWRPSNSDVLKTGATQVVAWGDGSPTREFLSVADAAQGIVAAIERFDGEAPINLGAGREMCRSVSWQLDER